MIRALFIFVSITFFSIAKQIETSQLIVVETPSWNSPMGVMKRFEKRGDRWVQIGKAHRVTIGRNGLAWGIGLHTVAKGAKPIKKEGDGRAPAGIFRLKHAFGYEPLQSSYPYKVYEEHHHCVDDSNSRYYNSIVDNTKVKKDYRSFEHMKFPKNYYRYGVVVDHNRFGSGRSTPFGGSCIFIHIKHIPTAGCTALKSEEAMKEVILWLDKAKHPLMVQAPKGVIKNLLKEVGFDE